MLLKVSGPSVFLSSPGRVHSLALLLPLLLEAQVRVAALLLRGCMGGTEVGDPEATCASHDVFCCSEWSPLPTCMPACSTHPPNHRGTAVPAPQYAAPGVRPPRAARRRARQRRSGPCRQSTPGPGGPAGVGEGGVALGVAAHCRLRHGRLPARPSGCRRHHSCSQHRCLRPPSSIATNEQQQTQQQVTRRKLPESHKLLVRVV